MSNNPLARMDAGDANRRILSRIERRTDFRRVEAASIKRKMSFQSHEAKVAFVRGFMSLQESVYVISEIARTKLPDEAVDQVEAALQGKFTEVNQELNEDFDQAEALLRNNGIEAVASYDTKPLEFDASVISAEGSEYLDLLEKLDQLMPILATLQIKRVLPRQQIAHKKARLKRIVGGLASTARNLKVGIRRRMNEADARAAAEAEAKGETTGVESTSPVGDPQEGEPSPQNSPAEAAAGNGEALPEPKAKRPRRAEQPAPPKAEASVEAGQEAPVSAPA